MAKTQKLFEISLLGTIFLLSFELSAGSSFYAVYIFLLGTVLSFAYLLFKNIKNESNRLAVFLNGLDFSSIGIITFFCLYIATDFINFLLSDYKDLAIGKYKVVVLMLFISTAIFVYVKNKRKEFNIHLSLGICSIFICVMSYFNYFVLRLYPIYYTLRLSLRSDYNMYVVAILTGLVCIFYYVKVYGEKSYYLYLYFIVMPLCSSCVILSGSRRGFLFLLSIGVIFLISDILPINKDIIEIIKKIATKIPIYLVIIAEIFLIVFISEKGLYALYEKHGSFINSQNEIVKIENETSYANRLETIGEGSFLTKRIVIWNEAIKEIQSFNNKNLVFGKGDGYDIYIYSKNTNEELNKLYDMDKNKFNLSPHCFILSDILCGGFWKAGISVLFWIFVGIKLIKIIIKEKMLSFLYIIPLGMVFLNSLISGRYGFLYDKYLYIFLVIILLKQHQKSSDII